MLVDPLATDYWVQQPCTPATLATLSLEVPPGSVWLEGCGMGHLQLVKVSGMNFVLYTVGFVC